MVRVQSKHTTTDYASLAEFCKKNPEFKYNSLRLKKKPFTYEGFEFSDITADQIKAERLNLYFAIIDRLEAGTMTWTVAKLMAKKLFAELPKRNRKKKQ